MVTAGGNQPGFSLCATQPGPHTESRTMGGPRRSEYEISLVRPFGSEGSIPVGASEHARRVLASEKGEDCQQGAWLSG